MLIVSEVGGAIQVVLSASVTTNELECYSSWRYRNSSRAEGYDYGDTTVYTSGTLPADVVPSPQDIGSQRVAGYMSVYNADTVDHEITIRRSFKGRFYTLWKGTLAPSEATYYIDGYGFTSNTTSPLLLRSVRTP